MITGAITADREAAIRFFIRGQNGREQEVRAVIDTGFNGYLTLPESLASMLGLYYHSQIVVMLGDGSDRILREYEATVVWDGRERDVLVLAAEGGPLIGMAMLYGHEVFLHVVDGGRVTIRAVRR